jgi:penicillin-binding protein 2
MSLNEYVNNPDEAKEYWDRYRLFYVLLTLTAFVFISRLWYLQIFTGSELRDFSDKNRLKEVKIPAPRGLILDRDGQILVQNLLGFEAVVLPQYIEDIDELSKKMGPIMGMEPDRVTQRIIRSKRVNGPFSPVKIKEGLSREEVVRLKKLRLDLPGLEIRETILRNYPLGEDGAQLFGYVGEISKKQLPLLNKEYKGKLQLEQGDIIGKSGLEETLELNVRGLDGVSLVQVDAHGRETMTSASPSIYSESLKNQEPVSGHHAVLTLDKDVQEMAWKTTLEHQRIGGIFAMKTNGEVLAWTSSPSFDPNELSTSISAQTWSKLINDPFKPLRNKVIQDHAAPGSTFKPLVAVAALSENVVNENTIVSAPGVFFFGKRPYHDSIKGGHGNITILQGIEESSNVFFYKMGIALGVDKMYDYISNLGVGHKTGIELDREVPGLMPNSKWKKENMGEEWQAGENLSTAIGQGFVTTTLIQLAVAYNSIATEGKVVKPFVIRKILDLDGKTIKEFSPQVLKNLQEKQANGIRVSKHTFEIVKEGMRRVANGQKGTARFWKIPGVEFAGKTGTAQVMSFSADQIYSSCQSRPIQQRHHGWFIGYAPADNPEIVIAVLAEHACHGNTGAVPLFRDVAEAYFKKYHPDWIEAGLKAKKTAKAPSTEKPATSEDE